MFPVNASWILFLMVVVLNMLSTAARYCPFGYHLNLATGICWYFESTTKDWHDAKTSCEVKGGKLGTYSGLSDPEFISNRWGVGQIWTGVNDLGEKGVHTDVDGNPLSWTYWSVPAENNQNNERCILMSKFHNGKWQDYPCTHKAYSVCMADEVTTKIYKKVAPGTQLSVGEIATYTDVGLQSCPVLCAATAECVSFARNGTNCKLLKNDGANRSYTEWDLFK